MRIYKRGKQYWFKLQFDGKVYRKSTGHTNKVEATGAASAFRTALANKNFGIVQQKTAPMFDAAMKSFLEWSKEEHKEHPNTYKRYKTSSKPLLAFLKFRGKRVDEITGRMIEDYKVHRSKQTGKRTKRPIKPATLNRELACLKAMFFHALKDGCAFKNPLSKKVVGEEAVRLLQENNQQDRVLTFDEQRQYLKAASANLKDVATLILETGMRPEEVYRARVDAVNLTEGYLFNPYGKTKAARREVPLNSVASGIIRRRIQSAKGPYLFPHRNDKNKPMVKANNQHTTALKNSKVRKFRLYDLRHTWATRAAESGMDISTLASLLGHAKLTMVSRYVHPGKAHRVEAVKKLETANAAREIAEVENRRDQETQGTKTGTVALNPGKFSTEETESKSHRIN